jgi:hypothetical protein
MNKRPGQVNVTVEVGYCTVCGRTRNLRREEHHLGALVRTIVSCETCHRTLSSSIGLASPETAVAEPEPAPVALPAEAPVVKAKPAAKAKTAVKKTAVKKAPAKRPTKTAARGGKPTSTATRRVTKKK